MSEERLQKILARAGIASRRKAEELIREARVTVNGRAAEIGDKADLERDAVKVDGKRLLPHAGAHRYLLLNKPKQVMSTLADPEGRTTVLDLVPPRFRKALVPVGRLDYNTEGLLLLTDDGDFAQAVAHPRHGCVKTYEVKVRGVPAERDLERLRAGIVLDGKRTAPCRIGARPGPRHAADGETSSWWKVELGEGRSRQIREMFQRIGHPVQKLRRVAIGPVADPDLPLGMVRELTEREVEQLRGAARRAAGKAGRADAAVRDRRARPAGRSGERPRQPARQDGEPRRRPAGEERAGAKRPPRGPHAAEPAESALRAVAGARVAEDDAVMLERSGAPTPAPVVVAVDGPSGVGKSTVARGLARRLGLPFLDTGAMYRAVALKVLARGVDPADRAGVAATAEATDVSLAPRPDGSFEVLLDGAPVGERIRTPAVSEAASAVSAYPEVRRRLVALQRATALRHGGVLEGRDVGTRVVPETPYKFFLDARPEVRFRRRHEELLGAGRQVSYEEVIDEITTRDRRDTTRADSPLTKDESYTLIDASDLSVAQVVEAMARAVEARRAEA